VAERGHTPGRSRADRPVRDSTMADLGRAEPAATDRRTVAYGRFLLLIAGTGGLLYGIDLGIIAAALLYLGKTVDLSIGQTSAIVAAVLGGSMLSSPAAGLLADWLGRRKVMILSGALFVVSIGLIVLSRGFAALFVGRLLQGMSGGVIAVVVPLYLAETLSATQRGRGTAIFQFLLTTGIALAALIGWYYTRQAETAIGLAAGHPALMQAAENHAWRGMFQAVIVPGLIFFAGAFFLSESPRWLVRQGRLAEAARALHRSLSEREAAVTFAEMQAQERGRRENLRGHGSASLLRRKYAVPFLLACTIVALNQATGINSILSYLVIILRQTGMSAAHATGGDFLVKLLCCGMTLVAVGLIESKGRRFLLVLGTAGICVALAACALLFHRVELKRVDVQHAMQKVQAAQQLHVSVPSPILDPFPTGEPVALTVLYSYGEGDRIETVLSNSPNPVLDIVPDSQRARRHPLVIRRAFYSPVPSSWAGRGIGFFLALFIAAFSVGPGVVGWLVLSELMPTRIRSVGIGIALLLNQGVSTLSAAVFLPVVGNHGYSSMFAVWGVCTLVYFLVALVFLPETKGKSLEEIETLIDPESTSDGASREGKWLRR
jgi:MFS transporter, SP family, solute carrier family 2 (myo-inositol transporter), member 13